MRRRSARRHKSSRKTVKRSLSFYLWLAILIVVLVLVGRVVYKNLREANVLGKSVFLAEDFQAPAPPPGDSGSSGGGGGGGGGGSAPPPQDQPQQQQQQQQQPPQQSQPQAPQNMQNTGPGSSGQGGNQPNNPHPGVSQEERRPLMNQSNGGSDQNPHPGTPQEETRPFMNQQNTGPSGSGQGGFQGNNQPSQEQQQRFQQVQQQWQQEAAKFGFQIQPGSSNQQGSPNQSGSQAGGERNINFPSIKGKFNVEVSGQGGKQQQININDGDTKINLGSFQAVKPDGSKFEINKDVAEKINAAIKLETGSEVSQEGNTFNIKRGDVSARTDMPIAFNVATKTFTVQTGSGEKEIKVLPDEAVTKIKELNSNFTANADDVKLTELENEPVFEIPGTSQQRFLGVLPVGIQQTTVLSAKDGNLVTTSESVISRILDTFSF